MSCSDWSKKMTDVLKMSVIFSSLMTKTSAIVSSSQQLTSVPYYRVTENL